MSAPSASEPIDGTEIERALNFGSLDDAVQAFERLAASTADLSVPATCGGLVNRVVALAVCARDSGDTQYALKMMLRLWKVIKERNLCLEILVILVLMIRDSEQSLQFITTVPVQLQSDKHIRLLIGAAQEQAGNIYGLSDALSAISQDDVSQVPTFRILRFQLILSLTRRVCQLVAQLGVIVASGEIVKGTNLISQQIYGHVSDHILRGHYLPEMVEGFLRESVFTVSPLVSPSVLCAIIADGIDEYEPEVQAIAMRFLVSFRDIERATACGRRLLATPIVSNPDFIKSLFHLGDITGDHQWRKHGEALSRAIDESNAAQGASWHQKRARQQFHEITARRLKHEGAPDLAFVEAGVLPSTRTSLPAATAAPHLFIGFFGQLRFPHIVLPCLRSYLENDLQGFRQAGGLVSVGMATWNVAGQRRFNDWDGAGFIFPHLPPEITNIIMRYPVNKINDVKCLLPNTADKVIEQALSVEGINVDVLRNICDDALLTSIESDEFYVKHAGAVISARCGGDRNLVNQGRMWNRIGALRNLVAEAEIRREAPVTHGLLIRPDLRLQSGSICSLLTKSLDREPNWLFADHDAHAAFIEGLGDRYILADRVALDRVLDGERLLLAAANKDGVDQSYALRFGAHQFLNTLLFEHGTQVTAISRDQIRFDLYRGEMSIDDLRDELVADRDRTTNLSLKEGLTALLK